MEKVNMSIVDHLRDPDSAEAIEQERMTQIQLDQKAVYLEHRIFLENYKKQRQKNSQKEENIQMKEVQQSSDSEQQRANDQIGQQQYASNIQYIMKMMQKIHKKLQTQFLQRRGEDDTNIFKIFTDVVQNKNDINRISKERSFIKAQTSNCFKYEEPRISSPMKLSQRQKRFFTQAVGIEKLNKQAKLFSERVQKEQEKLWGNHFLARRIQEKKRDLEDKKYLQSFRIQRQMRIMEKYSNQRKQHFQSSQVLQKQEGPHQQSSRNILKGSRHQRVLKKYLIEDKTKRNQRGINFETGRGSQPRQRARTQANPMIKTQRQETGSAVPSNIRILRANKINKKLPSRQMNQSKKDQTLNQISVNLSSPIKNQDRSSLFQSQQCSYYHPPEQEASSDCSSPLPRLQVKQSIVIINTPSQISD